MLSKLEELANRVRRLSSGYQGMDDQSAIASELEALASILGDNGPTFFPYPGRHPYFVTGSLVTENEIKAYDAGSAVAEAVRKERERIHEDLARGMISNAPEFVEYLVRHERERIVLLLEGSDLDGAEYAKILRSVKNPKEKP